MIEIGNINSTPASMVLEIKDVNNTVKVKYAIGEKDEINKEIMQRHDLSISFNYPTFISFKKGDYVSFDGIKYYLMNDYKAVDNNGQYKYDLVFHGKEMLFQDVQYWYDKNNVDQSEYGMTGNATYFLQLAVENINKHYGADFVIQGNAEPTEIKYISFANNTNVFDALNQVCNTFECKWLLEGDTINIVNKANFGDAVDFKVGETIQKISRRDGDSTFDAQRILALGSTRNLTEAYHGGDYMIGAKRLRIPTSKGKYIDLKPNLKPTEIKTATVIFDEIYPHRVGTMTAVRSVEYKDKDDEGNETILKQWRFKDNDIIFSEDYKLPDLPLTIVFQTGKLAGLHFDVEFVKSGYEENDNSQYYEIEANESYGAILPNDTLKPEVGDKYILYNFNIDLVSHVYVPEAENELFNYATKWLKDEWVDKGVYECPIMGRYARDNNVDLEIGQRVDLYSPLFNGKRESRVMAYSKPLLSKYDATYTIGDNKAYSSKSNINQRITKLELTEYADYNVSTSIGDVYVIKQFDNTRPSDFNVYSAKASNAKYFNKQTGDTVQGDTQFLRNVQTHGINISDVFQNSTFTAGALGSGFQVKRDANGESYAEFDNLFVRKNTVFTEITKAEIKSVGGLIILSLADLTASDVVDNGNSYRVYFDTQEGKMINKFALNDQVICQTFNGVEQKRYWRLVTGIGEDYIDISKTDAETNSKSPIKGDDIVQLGNRTDVNRQHAILLSAYGSDAPSIKQYSGINSYSLEGKEVTKISPSGNMFKGTFSIQSNGTTSVIYKDRGKFINGTTYYKNDRVSHNGSLWVCNVTSTKVMPNENTTDWIKETVGSTDIDDAKLKSYNYTRNFTNWSMGGASMSIINSNEIIFTRTSNANGVIISNIIKRTGKVIISVNIESTSSETTSIYVDGRGTFVKISHPSLIVRQNASVLYLDIPSGFNDRVVFEYYNNSTIDNNWYIGIEGTSKSNRIKVSYPQLLISNTDNPWTPNPLDTEQEIIDNKSISEANNNYINNVIKGQIEAIQDQLDGKVNSYFYDYDPTINNIPAVEWTTEQLKSEHLNDTFTNTDSGKSWRWAKENNVYKWVEITDTAALEALQKAQEALNIANDKMQVFVAEPYTPYKVGDLWVQGASGEIMKCKTTRLTGNYIASDWDRASKYTDDTKANQVGDDLEQLTTETKAEFNLVNDKINAKVDSQTFNQLNQVVQANKAEIEVLDKKVTTTVESVDNLQIGTLNYILDSSFFNSTETGFRFPDADFFNSNKNKDIMMSVSVKSEDAIFSGAGNKRAGIELLINYTDGTRQYVSCWEFFNDGVPTTIDRRIVTKFTIPSNKTVLSTGQNKTYIQGLSSGVVYVGYPQMELGNKPSDWSPSPQDIFTDINSKNRVFYQDNEPTEKHIGDLWIMKSFTDGNGIINTDQTKNIYQLQKRWNGTTWQIVGQNVNKSKVEQTDSQIRQTVEKTGIDQLGQGQNLYSVFNQRADEIVIEVSSVEQKADNAQGTANTAQNKANKAEQDALNAKNIADSKTTEAEVKAGIKVTPNGVNVYGNEFKVDSTLIANAIKTEDLEVVSKDSTGRIVSEFKVNSTGLLKAYGSHGSDNYLDIDSDKRSIIIASESSGSGIGDSVIGKSRTEMSEAIGGVRSVSNNNISTNSASVLSSVGLFANTAGQNMFPLESAINAKSSIVGLGWGNVPYRKYSTTNKIHFESFTAGVYGESANKGTAPSFGGFFNKLMAQGLFLSIRAVEINTILTSQDVVVTCYNQSDMTLTLPTNPIVGQFLLIRKMNPDKVYIRTIDNNKIHTDGSTTTSVDIKAGRGDMSMVIFDGIYWTYNFFGR